MYIRTWNNKSYDCNFWGNWAWQLD